MNEKTSIIVSESLLKEIDEVLDYPVNRSDFIEEAIKEYIDREKRNIKDRDPTGLERINHYADDLNREAEDILSYQVDI